MNISGKQLKAIRTALNWSQVELANRADVHDKTVAYWERNENLPEHSRIKILTALQEDGSALESAIQSSFETAALMESIKADTPAVSGGDHGG